MQIYGAGPLHGPHGVNPTHMQRTQAAPSASSAGLPQDHLEISSVGRMLEQIQDLPEIRHEKVAALRKAIASGTYDTPDRMNLALDRLLDEIG